MTPVSSLERLAAATIMASFTGPDVPDWLVRRLDDGLGGVCLFGSNLAPDTGEAAGASRGGPRETGAGSNYVESAARVSAALHAANPLLLVALDEEGGAVTRLEAPMGSSWPGNAALGATDDPDLTRRVAAALGELLLQAGIDLNLAPCADINVDAANPVIGVRSFGTDPASVSRHVVAFVQGLQGVGVAACVKHFPGHGATAVDSHLDLPEVAASRALFDRRELVPFAAAVAAGSAAIMTGHLRAPALDTLPATVSRPILTDLLRDEMGFTGAIVTDALDMQGIGGPEAIPANVVRSLAAGADFCCLGPDGTDDLVGACIDAVVGAIRSAALEEDRLADAAARVAGIAVDPRHQVSLGPAPIVTQVTRDDEASTRRARTKSSLGQIAARRALRIEGALAVPLWGAHVVELRRAPMIAAGEVPWGIGAPLALLDPTSSSQQLDDPDQLPAALTRAQGRGLVVVVRDPQVEATTAALLGALVEARPDVLVVDMGWPGQASGGDPVDGATAGPAPAARITTYGPSRASGEAVARLLAGLDPLAPASALTERSARG